MKRPLLLWLSLVALPVSAQSTKLPALSTLPAPTESKQILGTQSSDPTDNAPDRNGGIVKADTIGDLALATLLDSVNWYQDDGRYNDSDWRVDRATLSNGLDVFTIYESKQKATEFSSSKHGLFYRFAKKDDYAVYAMLGDSFSKVAQIPASQITPGAYTKLGDLVAEDVLGKRSFVIAPASTRVSLFSDLGNGVEGASLNKTPIGEAFELHFPVTGKPFDTWLDFQGAPGTYENIYGWSRQLFWVQNGAQIGLVWQSKEKSDKGQLYATWFSTEPYQALNKKLPSEEGKMLAAATSDDLGNLYYLLIQSGDGTPNDDRSATLIKTDANGKELKRTNPDTSKEGLDITWFGDEKEENNSATMKVSNGELALLVSRRMHQSPDGLNHQGAIAVVFDASTLKSKINLGQTSGHSFANQLITNSSGGFIGLDLGDNYPRGLNLHKITSAAMSSSVVYTFKTEHSTDCRPNAKNICRFEAFTEASTSEKTYYKWSNDNKTYTELGGVIETAAGWVVVFAGEHPNLDVTRVGETIQDPRDIGVVVAKKDFDKLPYAKEPNVVTDSLILSDGETSKGGFYDFGGRWNAQQSTGVNWLTSYPKDASKHASRVKTAKLANGDIFILWEEWSQSAYQETKAMTVRTETNKAGRVTVKTVQPAFSLGKTFRVNPRDELLIKDNTIYAASSDGGSKQLILRAIQTF